MHSSLNCAACGSDHDVDQLQNLCKSCGKPLLVHYDLESLKGTFTPEVVRGRSTRSMWRFLEVMPVADPAEIVSLGEGQTPLLKCRPHGAFEGFSNLWVKDESFNPTGSFKARGLGLAVSRALELGAEALALPSAGNAGSAAAAYGAAAGLPVHVVVPSDTPAPILEEKRLTSFRIWQHVLSTYDSIPSKNMTTH